MNYGIISNRRSVGDENMRLLISFGGLEALGEYYGAINFPRLGAEIGVHGALLSPPLALSVLTVFSPRCAGSRLSVALLFPLCRKRFVELYNV